MVNTLALLAAEKPTVGFVCFLGIMVVFVGLACLIGIISLMNASVARKNPMKAQNEKKFGEIASADTGCSAHRKPRRDHCRCMCRCSGGKWNRRIGYPRNFIQKNQLREVQNNEGLQSYS